MKFKGIILGTLLSLQAHAAPVMKVKSGLNVSEYPIHSVQLHSNHLLIMTDLSKSADLAISYLISYDRLKAMSLDSLNLAQSLMNKNLNITLYCVVDYAKIDPKEKAFECEGVTLLLGPN
jgi:hypothetical protein